jgi:hypothetical protein
MSLLAVVAEPSWNIRQPRSSMKAEAGNWNCRCASDAISLAAHQLMRPSVRHMKRIVRVWPYALVAISVIGFVYMALAHHV